MRRLSFVLAVVLVAAFPTVAQGEHEPPASTSIDNVEQRVTDHAFRTGADQDKPDVGGDYLVWRDKRGTHDAPYAESETDQGHIWSKNLSTRDELAVTTDLATDDANPRVASSSAGTWVVWTDHSEDPDGGGPAESNDDIYACQLPCTAPVQVTTHPAHQMNPAIDGTTVVWEDYRNAGTPFDPNDPDGVDLFMKDLSNLAAPETPVVTAPGNQASPSVSVTVQGKSSITAIAWRDSRDDTLPDASDADVWLQRTEVNNGKVKSLTNTKIADAAGDSGSLSPFQVAVSTDRILWNEDDGLGSLDLKSCLFDAKTGTCGAPVTVDDDAPIFDGQSSVLDLSGARAVWTEQRETGSHAYSRDLSTMGPIVPVDDTEGGTVSGARVDSERFAWMQEPGDLPHSGTDIYWRDGATQPTRANSINLGAFGSHFSPAADGDLVAYRRLPIEQGSTGTNESGQVWATSLSEDVDPRHFPVTTLFGTDFSRPAIVGDRIVFSQCAGGETFNDCGPVFERDLGADPEVRSGTDLSMLGPPDADGDSTAWRCGDTELCVHDEDSLDVFDVSGHFSAPPTPPSFSVMTALVRIADPYVVWHEFVFDPECFDPETCNPVSGGRLHAFNVDTESDVVVSDAGEAGGFGDFDISGTTVVMASQGDTIHTADVTDTCGGSPPCPVVLVTQVDHSLSSVSIAGERVAWVAQDISGGDCCGIPDVYTTTIGDSTPNLVTNELPNAFVGSPYVDGMGTFDGSDDRIYWVDHRHDSADIYVEPISATDVVIDPDITAPVAPTDALATRFGAGVEVSWTNPTDADFYRVRILRKSGSAPSGIDDVTASVVYEGSGTTFTDTDVVAGVTYHYAIFAFDYEPNFSEPDTASI